MKTNSHEKFDRWLIASVALHMGIVACVFVAPSLFEAKTAAWGSNAGSAGGVNVKIVNRISGIALPAPAVTAPDAAANENKSLYTNEPSPKVKAPPEKADPAAIQLPSKTAPKKPAVAAPVKTANNATPPAPQPSNAVAYGAGAGNPDLRYGQAGAGTGPTGAEFGGDGAFGDRYGAYVESMTRAIQNEWVKGASTNQGRAPKVYVTFTIARDGTVSNIQLEKPGNQPVMDRNALYAVRTAKLPPLPRDYRGSDVTVRFYFDYAQ